MVPVVDLTRRHAAQTLVFLDAVERVLGSGNLLLGAELEACEHELALLLGHRHSVCVSSGASGLQLALRAVGVSTGDEVIVPAFTAVPTAAAVCALGATPILVDVDPATAAIDAEHAADAITGRTRAIVPVHLYGRPVDLAPLVALGIPIVEDAAQAHGALRSITGAAAVYSFYPTKNLGGIGDGGAVATDDETLAATVRRLRVHGMTEQYVHVDISQNFRMSEIEAAFIRLQLARLDRRQLPPAGDRPALPAGGTEPAMARGPSRPRVPSLRRACGRARSQCAPSSKRRASRPRCTIRWRSPQQPAYRGWPRGRAPSPRPGRLRP